MQTPTNTITFTTTGCKTQNILNLKNAIEKSTKERIIRKESQEEEKEIIILKTELLKNVFILFLFTNCMNTMYG